MEPAFSRPAFAACSRGRLRHNLWLLAGALGGVRRVMAVLKADAYGHGAVEAGRTLAGAGVSRFGVATLEEGLALRGASLPGQVLLFGPLEPRDAREARRRRVDVTAWSRPWLDACSRLGPGGAPLRVHLKVDTGMGRLGFAPGDVPGLLGDFQSGRWPGLRLAGAYTHLACADERRDRVSAGQLRAFEALPWPAGLELHAANSAAALRYPGSRHAFARSGILLYGALDPALAPAARRQKSVLSAYATVLRVATLKKGRGLGYGHSFVAPRDLRVATICAGYADGVPRQLGGKAKVLVQGRPCALLGRVCMDFIMADVSRLPAVRPGAVVTLLEGLDGLCSARAWARLAGTNAYAVFCGLSGRLPRRWED